MNFKLSKKNIMGGKLSILLILTSIGLTAALIWMTHPLQVSAFSSYLGSAESTYPIMVGKRIDGCNLCHNAVNPNTSSDKSLNFYGVDFAANNYSLKAIENLNSDKIGLTNIQEINALTFPGDPNDPPPPPTNTPTKTPLPTATRTNTPLPTATRTNTTVPTAINTRTAIPPTATRTDTPLPTATRTNTAVPTAANTGTAVPPTATRTNTTVPTASKTLDPNETSTPTFVPIKTLTPKVTATHKPRPTRTLTRTPRPTRTPSPTRTRKPTRTPRPTRTLTPTRTARPTRTATGEHKPSLTPTPQCDDAEERELNGSYLSRSQSVSTHCDDENKETRQEAENGSSGVTDGKMSDKKSIQQDESELAAATRNLLVHKIIQWFAGLFPGY